MQKILGVKKLKHTLSTWPSHFYLLRRNENIYLHKGLGRNVQSSFVCNSPKLQRVQMFSNSWKYKLVIIYLLLSNKKELTWYNIDTSQNHGELKRQKKSTYYMIPFTQESRNSKLIYSDRKQISVCLGAQVHDSRVVF